MTSAALEHYRRGVERGARLAAGGLVSAGSTGCGAKRSTASANEVSPPRATKTGSTRTCARSSAGPSASIRRGGGGAAGRAEPAVCGEGLPGLAPAARLVFLNGRLVPARSGEAGELPEGVRVESLAHVLASNPERVESHSHLSDTGGGDNAFAALNHAFLGDGAVIEIPRGSGSSGRSSSRSSRGESPTS